MQFQTESKEHQSCDSIQQFCVLNKRKTKKLSGDKRSFFSFWDSIFCRRPQEQSISLCMKKKSKRKKPDEAWWSTKITAGLHTHPELPCLHGSNLFQLDMAAECVASASYTHFSHCTARKQSDGMHSDLTHTHTHTHTNRRTQVWKARRHMCEDTRTLVHARARNRHKSRLSAPHTSCLLLSGVIKTTWVCLRRSICERNLKLWNSIWSLRLCLSISFLNFFLLPLHLHFLCRENAVLHELGRETTDHRKRWQPV